MSKKEKYEMYMHAKRIKSEWPKEKREAKAKYYREYQVKYRAKKKAEAMSETSHSKKQGA